MMRKISCFTVGLVLAVGGVAMTAAPASAVGTPVETSAVSVKAALAPSCMTTEAYRDGAKRGAVLVRNLCKGNYRVKAIFARGTDSECSTINSGGFKIWKSWPGSKFDRLVRC